MKSFLSVGVLWALCLLISPALFSSTTVNQTAVTGDSIQVVVKSLTPTNFTYISDEAGTVSMTRASSQSENERQPAMITPTLSVLQMSTSDSTSSSSGMGIKTSTVGVATPTSSPSGSNVSSVVHPSISMATSPVTRAAPTTRIPFPVSYSPPPHVPSSSQATTHPAVPHSTWPPILSTNPAPTNSPQPTTDTGKSDVTTHPVSTGCAPPITVTISDSHCSMTPSPGSVCSSDCGSAIGLSLGIGIPATAIITFLLTSLSCLCCQRVKKKHSYIQLAPTVYFDEEEHD